MDELEKAWGHVPTVSREKKASENYLLQLFYDKGVYWLTFKLNLDEEITFQELTISMKNFLQDAKKVISLLEQNTRGRVGLKQYPTRDAPRIRVAGNSMLAIWGTAVQATGNGAFQAFPVDDTIFLIMQTAKSEGFDFKKLF